MAGFRMDAEDAARLAAEIESRNAVLMPKIRDATQIAGKQIRALAFQGAPRGPHTQTIGFARGFTTRTRQLTNGTEVTIENKSPLGTIIVFGASKSGPHDSPGRALEAVYPSWEAMIASAAEGVI